MDGLDGHFSNGKLQYKIFAAGIGWASGLMLRKAPIFGSSTTRTLFPLFSYDNAIFISSCIVCKYCHIVFAPHFLCPKWAAARQTGSKSKKNKIKIQQFFVYKMLNQHDIYRLLSTKPGGRLLSGRTWLFILKKNAYRLGFWNDICQSNLSSQYNLSSWFGALTMSCLQTMCCLQNAIPMPDQHDSHSL